MKGWVHLLVFASIALRVGASPNSIIGTGEDFDLELGHHFVKGAFGETPHKHCQRHKGPDGWVHLAKVILQVQTQILIEFHLQNLDSASTRNLNQTSASPLNLKFKILTQPSFRIPTKIQLHNLYKTSAAKCWTSSSFKILLNFRLQNLDQPLCSKSEGPNVSSQICNKLLPTWSSLSTSATVTTVGITAVSQSVSHSVSQFSDKHSQWSDSGPIKSSS